MLLPTIFIAPYQAIIADLLKYVEDRFQQVAPQQFRLHGDCHPGNILWTDQGPHFVDFDDSRNGPAIQDLWMLLSGEIHEQEKQLREILEGYEEYCDFNAAELNLIEPLRSMRIIHYAGWLAKRWPERLGIDWPEFSEASALDWRLNILMPYGESLPWTMWRSSTRENG